jgi:flagellar biosynthesis/type III secretory pathway protein FliH
MIKGYQYQSDFAKKHYAQGYAEGRAEAYREGLGRAVLRALRARGIAVADEERERILAEKDVERLERWFDRAMVAASLADVFDETS